MSRAFERPAARRDFIIHYAYLAENAGLETAKRFRAAVESTYAQLAGMPGMGAPAKVLQGKHSGVRIWRVRDFEDYLIAYRPHRAGVAIQRLVHGRRDYRRILT